MVSRFLPWYSTQPFWSQDDFYQPEAAVIIITSLGQIVARDYTGFSQVTLQRTDPVDVKTDIVTYDGQDFSIRNAFDVDKHSATQVHICLHLLQAYV